MKKMNVSIPFFGQNDSVHGDILEEYIERCMENNHQQIINETIRENFFYHVDMVNDVWPEYAKLYTDKFNEEFSEDKPEKTFEFIEFSLSPCYYTRPDRIYCNVSVEYMDQIYKECRSNGFKKWLQDINSINMNDWPYNVEKLDDMQIELLLSYFFREKLEFDEMFFMDDCSGSGELDNVFCEKSVAARDMLSLISAIMDLQESNNPLTPKQEKRIEKYFENREPGNLGDLTQLLAIT